MTVVQDVIDRLKAEVTALHGRVEGAAELAALLHRGQGPQRMPAAFVLPLGEDADPNGHANIHSQRITEAVGVIVVERHAGDATGGEVLDRIAPLLTAVRAALAGWTPASAETVVDYVRSRLVGLKAGAVFIQQSYATAYYLRKV